jgi:ABC-type polysaccharide/polyol phosphate export permease
MSASSRTPATNGEQGPTEPEFEPRSNSAAGAWEGLATPGNRRLKQRTSSANRVIVRSEPPSLVVSLRSAWLQRELLWNLALRDLRTRYRRSLLGWGWSLINPLVSTAVYSFVFTVVFPNKPAPGDPSGQSLFAVFLLSALLPWGAFNGGTSQAVGALIGGSSMMGKVNFAREHLVLGSVIATILSLAVELVVLTAVVTVMGYQVLYLLPILVFLTFTLGLFVSGVSLWLAALNVRYRDVQHLIGVVFLVLFYMTPIVYSPLLVPKVWSVAGLDLPLRSMLLANPMARFVEAYRNCFYDVRVPKFKTLAYLTVSSSFVFIFGYNFFTRRSGRFIEDM